MTPNTYVYFDYYQTKDIANEPEAMIENIAKGRLGKFLKEVCLLKQESIMDPKKTVADPELKVLDFKRFTLKAE